MKSLRLRPSRGKLTRMLFFRVLKKLTFAFFLTRKRLSWMMNTLGSFWRDSCFFMCSTLLHF